LLASSEISRTAAVKCFPKVNNSVAASISQGSTAEKFAPAFDQKQAPAIPPNKLMISSGIRMRRGIFR